MVTTGEPVRVLDQWQQDHRIGPCIDAAEQQQPVTIDDTLFEQRWDGFGVQAEAAGVPQHALPATAR